MMEVAEIHTARLVMVAITAAMLAAEAKGNDALAVELGARLTEEWPPEHWEPHVLNFIAKQYEDEPRTEGWHRYVLLPDAEGKRTLVGCVGAFPKPEGDAEIGYSTLPSYQRRGFATEATQALVAFLMEQPEVASVSAQTYPRLPESVKVMERCGMTFVGAGDEEGTVRYRRMRHEVGGAA